MKTVGELREFIKDLPDDMLLVKYDRNMETSGYRNSLFADTIKMKTETKETWDRFDGGNYSYEVFEPSENGELCMRIL